MKITVEMEDYRFDEYRQWLYFSEKGCAFEKQIHPSEMVDAIKCMRDSIPEGALVAGFDYQQSHDCKRGRATIEWVAPDYGPVDTSEPSG